MTTIRSAEAGFSILELLIVAAILSGLAVLAAASLRPPAPPSVQGSEQLFELLLEARSVVVLSGTTGIVTLEPGHARFRDHAVEWTGELQVGSIAASGPYRLVVNPDGTFSGERLAVLSAGKRQSAPGIYRSEARQ